MSATASASASTTTVEEEEDFGVQPVSKLEVVLCLITKK